MKYHWLLGVCLLASLLGVSVSCNTGSGAETHGSQSPAAMSVLLNEFAFVGSEPIHQEDIGRHEVVPISPPTHYTVGHQYIFHHRDSPDNDELFDTLQLALRTKGVVVKEATRDSHRYLGGLAFHIRLIDQGYTLTLYNRLDSRIVGDDALLNDWYVDDYILVVEDGPSA